MPLQQYFKFINGENWSTFFCMAENHQPGGNNWQKALGITIYHIVHAGWVFVERCLEKKNISLHSMCV